MRKSKTAPVVEESNVAVEDGPAPEETPIVETPAEIVADETPVEEPEPESPAPLAVLAAGTIAAIEAATYVAPAAPRPGMKVVVLKEQLLRGLKTVKPAVPKNSSLPILQNVLLRAEGEGSDGVLTLAGTNLETAIVCRLGGAEGEAETPVQVVHEGAITLPMGTFSDTVSKFPNGPLTLELNEENLSVKISYGKSKVTLKGIDAEDFPVIGDADEREICVLSASVLEAIASRVAIAAAQDDNRPVLQAVCLQFRGNAIEFSATDGFRLAVQRVEFPNEMDEPEEYLLLAKDIARLASIAQGLNSPAVMARVVDRGQVAFSFKEGSVRVFCRMIEGRFPDYRRIIPTESNTTVWATVAELRGALDLLAPVANASGGVIKMEFDGEERRLVVSANGSEVGEADAEVSVDDFDGNSLAIAAKGKFLSDALASIDGEDVRIELQSPDRPLVFRVPGSDAYTHLVMPMSLR